MQELTLYFIHLISFFSVECVYDEKKIREGTKLPARDPSSIIIQHNPSITKQERREKKLKLPRREFLLIL